MVVKDGNRRLFASDEKELHEFAAKIGIKQSMGLLEYTDNYGAQTPFYRLESNRRYRRAAREGAKEVAPCVEDGFAE